MNIDTLFEFREGFHKDDSLSFYENISFYDIINAIYAMGIVTFVNC